MRWGFHLLHGPCQALPPLRLYLRSRFSFPQHPIGKSGETGSCCRHRTGNGFLPGLIHDPTTAVVCGRNREQVSARPRHSLAGGRSAARSRRVTFRVCLLAGCAAAAPAKLGRVLGPAEKPPQGWEVGGSNTTPRGGGVGGLLGLKWPWWPREGCIW